MDGTQFNIMLGALSQQKTVDASKLQAGCPDENIFAGYLSDSLAEPERENIESHMAECDLCRHGMYDLKMLMDQGQNDAPEELISAVKKNLTSTLGTPELGRKIKI